MSEQVVAVPSGVWWDLPNGRGQVWQESGSVATLTLTDDGMMFGGEPGVRWILRLGGYDPNWRGQVTLVEMDTNGEPRVDPRSLTAWRVAQGYGCV